MGTIPYTNVPSKIAPLFGKIQTTGIPLTVDKKWLSSVGFDKGPDATLLRVLKALKFLDGSGKPTDFWKSYKNKAKSKLVLAKAVRKAYSGLFDTYNNAHAANKEDIKNYMRSVSGKADRTIDFMYTTFRNLCALSDFPGTPPTEEVLTGAKTEERPDVPDEITKVYKEFGEPVTININIQLTLPETKDIEVYDNLFKSLRKYMISENE